LCTLTNHRFISLSIFVQNSLYNQPRLPLKLDFNPLTHPIPTEKPVVIPILTEPKNPVSFLLMSIFSVFISLYIVRLHCTIEETTTVEINWTIWRTSNINYYIYAVFKAFQLNLTFKNPHKIPISSWGLMKAPCPSHTHTMKIPIGISNLRQP